MLCARCNTQIVEGGKFCTKCGSSVSSSLIKHKTASNNTNASDCLPIQNSLQSQWTEFARKVYIDIKTHGKYTGNPAKTNLSPTLAPNAKRIAAAQFIAYMFIGIGDGSINYSHLVNAGYAFVSTPAMIGYNVASIINKIRATNLANPHWVEFGRGTLIVTDIGFILLYDAEGIKTISYSSFVSAKMSRWNCVEFDYITKDRTIKYAFTSDNALVAFVCYCLKRDPSHYQLNDIFGKV